MASRGSQRSRLPDLTELFEHEDMGLASPPYNSVIWWSGRKEHTDNEDLLKEQLKAMDDHVARLQEMLQCEQTKCSRLQLRYNHQEAELRRREQNMNRMKERFSLFTDRRKDKAPTMKILNTLPCDRGQREHPSAKKQEDRTVRLMLERREAELREAMKLRHSLTSLLHALRCDMEQTICKLEGCKDGPCCVDKRLDQAERALGDHVTGGVVQSWRQVQRRLGTFRCEGTTEFGTDHDKLMAQLESELRQSQQLVQMQQQLLQDGIGSPVPSELGDCYFIEEWSRLQEHWAEFKLQRKTFERERQAFTDAAIRLSHERCDFEQLKASLLKQEFLCDSPVFQKGTQSNTIRESAGLNFSEITPLNTSESPMVFSPAAKREDVTEYPGTVGVLTPSTPELYHALSLSYSPYRSVNVSQVQKNY